MWEYKVVCDANITLYVFVKNSTLLDNLLFRTLGKNEFTMILGYE